jgi:hypothetical protein
VNVRYIGCWISVVNSKIIIHFATHVCLFLSLMAITWLKVESPAVSHSCSRFGTLMVGPLCPLEVLYIRFVLPVKCSAATILYAEIDRQTVAIWSWLNCVGLILFCECIVFESRLPHACVLLHTLQLVLCSQFPAD